MHKKILIIFMVLAFVLRLLFAFIQPLSVDELLTYDVISLTSLRDIFIHIFTHDLQMPSLYTSLYFLKNYIYDHYLFFRILFSFFSILTIYISYLTGRLIGGVKLGFVIAFLFSFSFSIILFSVEFRPYSPLLLISMTMCWVYIKREKNFFLPLLILGMLGASFHYYGALLIVPYLLLEQNYFIDSLKKSPLLNIFITLIGTLILLLLMPIVLRNYNMEHTYREDIKYFGLFELLDFLSLAFWGPVGFTVTLLAYIYFIYQSNDRVINRKIISLIFIGIVPMIIILIKSLTSTPTLEPRYLVSFVPPILVAASIIFERLKLKYLIFMIILYDLLIYRNIFRNFRQDTRLLYAASHGVARDLGIPLISCGVCFWPYAQGGDSYHCYKSGDLGNMAPLSSILIIGAVDNSFCLDIFGPKILKSDPIQTSGSYKIYQYNNPQ